MLNKRVFKKYPNRRLYDKKNSCYVNLDVVKKSILALEAVEVIDVQTGKDITSSVLLQIINKQQEDNKQNSLMTSQTLTNLIILYNTPYGSLFSQFLENTTAWLTDQYSLDSSKTKDKYNYFDFTSFNNPMLNFNEFSKNIEENWNKVVEDWKAKASG